MRAGPRGRLVGSAPQPTARRPAPHRRRLRRAIDRRPCGPRGRATRRGWVARGGPGPGAPYSHHRPPHARAHRDTHRRTHTHTRGPAHSQRSCCVGGVGSSSSRSAGRWLRSASAQRLAAAAAAVARRAPRCCCSLLLLLPLLLPLVLLLLLPPPVASCRAVAAACRALAARRPHSHTRAHPLAGPTRQWAVRSGAGRARPRPPHSCAPSLTR